jgi:hypothetical protein
VYDGADPTELVQLETIFQQQKGMAAPVKLGPGAYLLRSVNTTMQALTKAKKQLKHGRITWAPVESTQVRTWQA